ncbi:MAG: hypothetical protein AAFX87_16450 [Bacteroidota bacterium]
MIALNDLSTGLYKVKYNGAYNIMRVQRVAGKLYYDCNFGPLFPLSGLFESHAPDIEVLERFYQFPTIIRAQIILSWKDEVGDQYLREMTDVHVLGQIFKENPEFGRRFGYRRGQRDSRQD